MATKAQIQANRANAQKSTGPRTPQGKARVSQQAGKSHRLRRTAVLPGEDWEEYTCGHEDMFEELYLDGRVEVLLAAPRHRPGDWSGESWGPRYRDRGVTLSEDDDGWGPPARPARAGGVGTRAAADPSGETKPNSFPNGGPLPGEQAKAIGEARFICDPVVGTLCEQPRAPVTTSPPAEDLACETNPISAGTGPVGEDRLCETNPISPEPNEGQVLWGQEVTNGATQDGLGKTKPIRAGQTACLASAGADG